MAIQFGTIDKVLQDHGFKSLVYAPAGHGKTALCRTLPGRKCIIGIERGLISLAPANQQRLFGNVEQIHTMQISSATDFREAFQIVEADKGKMFDSVGLDSISEIAEKVVSERLATNKDGRKAYGEANEFMAKYIKAFRDLPNVHVLMTAKMDRTQDENGKLMYSPSMPGKTLTQDLPHYFDEVFYLGVSPDRDEAGRNRRFLRCWPDVSYNCKDRSGALAEYEFPNLATIIAKIKQQTQ